MMGFDEHQIHMRPITSDEVFVACADLAGERCTSHGCPRVLMP